MIFYNMFRPLEINFRFILESNVVLVLCIIFTWQMLVIWYVYWTMLPDVCVFSYVCVCFQLCVTTGLKPDFW